MSTPMRCVCFKQEAAQHTPLEDVKQLFSDVGFKVPCHGLFSAQDRCLAQGASDRYVPSRSVCDACFVFIVSRLCTHLCKEFGGDSQTRVRLYAPVLPASVCCLAHVEVLTAFMQPVFTG